nr:hypothetical protein [Candidatus Sigynarchaeota archaeon]
MTNRLNDLDLQLTRLENRLDSDEDIDNDDDVYLFEEEEELTKEISDFEHQLKILEAKKRIGKENTPEATTEAKKRSPHST